MSDRGHSKVCGVCGYTAMGKNFGALSCEPCKAFFRRNALKTTLKCHFDNNCKINEITRKFCTKCRLEKCLAIGMRRDWLLNEEERDMKRLRILENKKKKGNSFNSNTSDESPKSLIDRSPEALHENHISNTINTTNSDILCEILDDNNFSADALNRQIMDIECILDNGFNEKNSFENTNNLLNDQQISCYNNCNEITSQTDYEVSNETIEKAVEFAVSVIPIARPQREFNTGFNEKEIYLMNELMRWSQFMCTPHISYVRSITDLTKTVKGLSAFRDICCEDQISLLKYGCFEVIFLRTIVYFDCTDNTLKLPLMSSIILFNPDHPNLVNKDVIKEAQRKNTMEDTPKTLIPPLLEEVFDMTPT
ncbi:unnamed protein product [Oppiella nova]|uniref:Uncharacterized protein n=1 Tax=Oppiella nova TaxID=334625 RepID=A0A7R9QBH5_9ACAR|nr:unnamed protein product [Oppiella nova]CAG2162610.1 unnamed protein product [Oppiella nova]